MGQMSSVVAGPWLFLAAHFEMASYLSGLCTGNGISTNSSNSCFKGASWTEFEQIKGGNLGRELADGR